MAGIQSSNSWNMFLARVDIWRPQRGQVWSKVWALDGSNSNSQTRYLSNYTTNSWSECLWFGHKDILNWVIFDYFLGPSLTDNHCTSSQAYQPLPSWRASQICVSHSYLLSRVPFKASTHSRTWLWTKDGFACSALHSNKFRIKS